MSYEFNPFTKKLDKTGSSDINQTPIGDADTYFKWVAPDTLQLWVNGALRQEWVTAVSSGSGSPMGLLLALTNA